LRTTFGYILFLVVFQIGFSQSKPISFFKPSDSLNLKKAKYGCYYRINFGHGTLIGLNEVWYELSQI
jgi:hypothetical protein